MKFYEGGRGGKKNKWLNFGGDADCPIGNPDITQRTMSRYWWSFQDICSSASEQWIKFLGWSGSSCWLSKSQIQAMSCLRGDLRSWSALVSLMWLFSHTKSTWMSIMKLSQTLHATLLIVSVLDLITLLFCLGNMTQLLFRLSCKLLWLVWFHIW